MLRNACIFALVLFATIWIGCSRSTAQIDTVQLAVSTLTQQPQLQQTSSTRDANLTEEEKKELLNQHNQVREKVGVAAMRWSEDLAAYAQAWGQELDKQDCTIRHRPQSGPFAQKYGENIYWASAVIYSDGNRAAQEVAPMSVVDYWADEKQWYSHASNTCSAPSDQGCGHYTQMVWANSTELGCSKTLCTDNSQIWICNYNPPGNYLGEKPY